MNNIDDLKKEISNYSNGTQEKLIRIFEVSKKTNNFKENDLELYSLIEEVFNEIFNPNKVYLEPLIPLSFFKGTLGSFLINLLNEMENRLYTVGELVELTKTEDRPNGYSYQYISQEIRSNRLNAIKDGNRWLIPNTEVRRFLNNKGLK